MNRRTFLKTSTIALATTAISKGAKSQSPKIRVGIIGCRNRGPQVAENLAKSGYFTIKTICDCDEEMLKNGKEYLSKKNIEVQNLEKDFRKILEDKDIDAVVVATPDHWHSLMTVMALDAGKHVYVEKPFSYNIYDGYAVLEKMKKHPNLTVIVGSQQRSGKHFQDAKEFIQSGGIGKIAFARAGIIHWREPLPRVPDSEPPKTLNYDMWTGPAPLKPYNQYRVHYNWHFIKDYGTGDTGNWGAHWLDIIRWFLNLDYPLKVHGTGGQFITKDIKEFPDTQTNIIEYPELTVVWELRLWSEFEPSAFAEFHGDNGSVIITRAGWKIFDKEGKKPPKNIPGMDIDIPHAINFAKAIMGEASPNAPAIEGHKSAVLCHLCNISAILQKTIKFNPETLTIENDSEANSWVKRQYREPWNIEKYI
ncbi:MAG: Gfo/Idh/MocA family oxidoreductase [Candidatus Hydrogenedentes bacterium]|nr:Gfo/Idh/MocA family oxidoreductase [Candidatus Hydrogenedentota bacterium]